LINIFIYDRILYLYNLKSNPCIKVYSPLLYYYFYPYYWDNRSRFLVTLPCLMKLKVLIHIFWDLWFALYCIVLKISINVEWIYL